MIVVTKDWLSAKIAENPTKVIGRALVAIFNRQTADERNRNTTQNNNGVGFTQGDARIGCIGAKYFLKHGTLEDWQLKIWLMPNGKGQPRIVKYSNQLNEIAKSNQQIENHTLDAITYSHMNQYMYRNQEGVFTSLLAKELPFYQNQVWRLFSVTKI